MEIMHADGNGQSVEVTLSIPMVTPVECLQSRPRNWSSAQPKQCQ